MNSADSKVPPENIDRVIQNADEDVFRKGRVGNHLYEQRLQGEEQRIASVLECRHERDANVHEEPLCRIAI